MKSKDELLAYSKQIIERGDGYRAVLNYLKTNCDDEDMIKEIISEVQASESKEPEAPQTKKKLSFYKLIFGGAFVLSGIFLLTILWSRGYIATLPFLLIGSGIYAIATSFNDDSKGITNVVKKINWRNRNK